MLEGIVTPNRTGLTLKVAFVFFCIARKGGLWLLILENLQDLLVRDVAVLEVLPHHKTILIADCPLFTRNQNTASIICLADIAVNTSPSITAVALCPLPWWPVLAIGQRTTQWF